MWTALIETNATHFQIKGICRVVPIESQSSSNLTIPKEICLTNETNCHLKVENCHLHKKVLAAKT